jgi:probable phosphoglycerate mutase
VIWLVRHGETEWSRDGRHTSHTDLPLTAHGRGQAAAIARQLHGHAFARVLCSPLRRARETAQLLDVADVEIDDDLSEIDYGDYEGLTSAEIRESVPGWTVFTHDMPGGESLDHAAARADRVIWSAEDVGDDVLLVAHGHILRILAARWLEQPPSFGARLLLETATVSVLGYERETRAMRRWNVG